MHVLAGARDRIKYWQSATQELVTTGYEHYLTLAADGTTARLCLLAVNRKAENCEHDHDRHGGLARLPTLEKKCFYFLPFLFLDELVDPFAGLSLRRCSLPPSPALATWTALVVSVVAAASCSFAHSGTSSESCSFCFGCSSFGCKKFRIVEAIVPVMTSINHLGMIASQRYTVADNFAYFAKMFALRTS